MGKKLKRTVSALMCLAVLATFFVCGIAPTRAAAATVEYYTSYTDVTTIYNQSSCPSMQGFDIDTTYAYCAKINTDTETAATIARVNKDTGDTVWLTNSATGTIYFSQIAHANDLAICEVNGVKTLFVATGGAGIGDYSLVRFALNGTTLTQVGHYRVQCNGSDLYLAGVKVKSINDSEIELVFKKSKYIYTGTVGVNATSGIVDVKQICTLDLSKVTLNGVVKDLSNYVQQGFEYIDNKIFVPLTGDSSATNVSLIAVYDIVGVSGTITNDPTLSFYISSSTYADLFEIESCAICPSDGKLYFNTNRRVTRSDANHDGIHYINNYVYDPAKGDTKIGNYRWEVLDDTLVSVTTGGAAYNTSIKLDGSISGGTFSNSRYHLNDAVILQHDKPWILEWKASGIGSGTLLLSSKERSNVSGSMYIYRRKGTSVLALGEYADGNYQNYGIDLSTTGIDATAEHVYSLRNRIASDGTNMVYLYVDGKEIGPMNNYFIAATSQGTTSNWVSGKDFKFSYAGTVNHPIQNCKLEYIQVWGNGIQDQVDEPNTYRWETVSDQLTAVSGTGLTANTAQVLTGSCSGGTFTDAQFALDKSVVLLHDRPWSMEWKSSGAWTGGPMLFTSTKTAKQPHSAYLYRRPGSSFIALGEFRDGAYYNYGIQLSDHGIDGSVEHIYRLTNKIADDGSNMVYLYVDGKEVGPLNNYYYGATAQGTTSDWVSGKDFTFTSLGSMQFKLNDCAIEYLQVWEAGIPSENAQKSYRWEAGASSLNSVTTDVFSENNLTVLGGTTSNGTFDDSYFRLDKQVVLAHDRPWSVEWQSEGSWKDGSNGGFLFSASNLKNEVNAPYLYRRNDSTFIAFGERRDGAHNNYGVSLSGHGIDGTAPHVYKLTNKVADDGSNMVYLYVDGQEIGPMNEYFLGGTAQGTTSDWVSGKDFVFSYIGTAQFPISNCTISYVQVWEGCTHVYGQWSEVEATCVADGSKTRVCSECGNVEKETVKATGHNYTEKTVEGNCLTYPHTEHTCQNCGDTYSTFDDGLMSDWSATKPDVDDSLIETKQQYRYSDYETKTSYETSLDGYTQIGGTWDTAGTSGSVQYVNSWPSGFSTSNSLYTKYNKKSSKVTAGETETLKTVVNSDAVTGYLYYHWCYANSVYSVASQSGSYTTFHAYYDTTAPGNFTCDTSDMSYQTAHSTCSNSEWFFVAEVNTQKYTTYKKLFTYERWTDWSDWSDTAVEASDTRKVETQTLYRYVTGAKGDHTWVDGICSVCGETCAHPTYANGVCTTCGKEEPAAREYYLFGYINGKNYACEEDFMNIGSYKFVEGQLTVTFTETSYVAVKTDDNANWYMTNGWQGEVNSVTLYNTTTLGTNADKLYVPGGVEVTFTLVNNGNDTFTLSYTATEPDPVVKPEITLKYPTLSFEGEVFYNVYYTVNNATVDVEDMGLLTWYNRPANTAAATYDTAEAIIPGAVYNSGSNIYMVHSEGVPAKMLGDNMYLRVYAKLSDGTYAYSPVTYYNAKFYASDILANSTNADMKSLVVAMLNYGAAAQVHFDHNADNLMNASLTAAQKALAKDYSADMISTVVTPSTAKTVNFKSNGGFSGGYPSVSFDGAFSINYYLTPKKTVESTMTLYCWNLATYNSVSTLTEANATAKVEMVPATNPSEYFANYTGIAAKQIDETVFVAGVYTSGGVRYSSPVLYYSLSAYCADQISKGSATMQDFAKATVVYGDAAKTYFANLNG